MGLDLELIPAIAFGGIFIVLVGALFYSVIVGNEDPAHVEEFCPEGVKYLGANDINYCQGEPFVCANKECYYVKFQEWEEK